MEIAKTVKMHVDIWKEDVFWGTILHFNSELFFGEVYKVNVPGLVSHPKAKGIFER